MATDTRLPVKRALVVHYSNNPAAGLGDLDALGALLAADPFHEWMIQRHRLADLGKTITHPGDRLPLSVEGFDLILYIPPLNALHVSSHKGSAEAVTDLVHRARPGALMLPVCDVLFSIDLRIRSAWTREWYDPFKERPVRILGSFDEGVLDDQWAMTRIGHRFIRRTHPDSTFIPLEWLFGYAPIVEARMKTALHSPVTDLMRRVLPVDRFYYGLARPGIGDSLRRLDFGQSPTDAVVGKIAAHFPLVRDATLPGQRGVQPPVWAPLVAGAQRNLYPYEPVKGDHQVTLRMAELAVLADPDSIVVDARVAPHVLAYRDFSLWPKKAETVATLLGAIL